MHDATPEERLQHLQALTGTWTTEGTHPLLPGEVVRGRAEFAWLESGHFLTWRSSSEHPQVPDALAVIGVVDGRLAMHYFDARGVHRLYAVDADEREWHLRLDDPAFAQRTTGSLTGDELTLRGAYSRDGGDWEEDLTLTLRRTR
ncbi:hypothetical protein [Geodermatophilus sp. FMUSA9-8]|uniref:hypothetical protein n=1 Tax=Geodermatophilus sp. FMUSA9-8 TaxID=3120155 RepID=UPI00300BA895